jgi:hypothetical protein
MSLFARVFHNCDTGCTSSTINTYGALSTEEELVVWAVLRVVSSVRSAVYDSADALNAFELFFNLDLPLTSTSKCFCCRGVKAAVKVSRLLSKC